MPRVGKAHLNSVKERELFIIPMRHELLENAFRVLHRVERHIRFFTAALAFAVAPFRFKLLNVCAVSQHDVAQIAGWFRGVYLAMVTVLV